MSFKWAKASAARAWKNRSVQRGFSDDGRPKYEAADVVSRPPRDDKAVVVYVCEKDPTHVYKMAPTDTPGYCGYFSFSGCCDGRLIKKEG